MELKDMDKKIKIGEYEDILNDLAILSDIMAKSEQVKLALAVSEGQAAINVINKLKDRLDKHKVYMEKCQRIVESNPRINKSLIKQPVPITPDQYRAKMDTAEEAMYAEEQPEPEFDGNMQQQEEQPVAQEVPEYEPDMPKEIKMPRVFPTGKDHPRYTTGRSSGITTSERPIPVPDTSKVPPKQVKPTMPKNEDDDLMNEIDKMFLKGDENIEELK